MGAWRIVLRRLFLQTSIISGRLVRSVVQKEQNGYLDMRTLTRPDLIASLYIEMVGLKVVSTNYLLSSLSSSDNRLLCPQPSQSGPDCLSLGKRTATSLKDVRLSNRRNHVSPHHYSNSIHDVKSSDVIHILSRHTPRVLGISLIGNVLGHLPVHLVALDFDAIYRHQLPCSPLLYQHTLPSQANIYKRKLIHNFLFQINCLLIS